MEIQKLKENVWIEAEWTFFSLGKLLTFKNIAAAKDEQNISSYKNKNGRESAFITY